MTTLTITHPYPLFVRGVNTGFSPESKQLQRSFEKAVTHFRSICEREKAFSDLVRAVKEASQEDWDHFGAKPASILAANLAIRFLNALPSALPTPDVGIDPDGDISFEWVRSKDRMFTVSLSRNGKLSYAGLFGNEISSHGTEVFDDTIPRTIIENVKRLGVEG